MGHKLPPDQLALYKKIDYLLLNEWDPIGVSDFSDANDEYHSYLPKVFRLALDGAGPKAIAKYLLQIEKEYMGLRGDFNNCAKVAKAIVREKEELNL